jgi:DNA-directed RNA polymerase subunit RPC12/RpoP
MTFDAKRYVEEHEDPAHDDHEDACPKCGGTRTVILDLGFGKTEEVECDACEPRVIWKPNRSMKHARAHNSDT